MPGLFHQLSLNEWPLEGKGCPLISIFRIHLLEIFMSSSVQFDWGGWSRKGHLNFRLLKLSTLCSSSYQDHLKFTRVPWSCHLLPPSFAVCVFVMCVTVALCLQMNTVFQKVKKPSHCSCCLTLVLRSRSFFVFFLWVYAVTPGSEKTGSFLPWSIASMRILFLGLWDPEW